MYSSSSVILVASVLSMVYGATTKIAGLNANSNLQCAAPLIEQFPLSLVTNFMANYLGPVDDPVPTPHNICKAVFNGRCTYNVQEMVSTAPSNLLFRCQTTSVCPSDLNPLFANRYNIVCTDEQNPCTCSNTEQIARKCAITLTGVTLSDPLPQPYFCTCCNKESKKN